MCRILLQRNFPVGWALKPSASTQTMQRRWPTVPYMSFSGGWKVFQDLVGLYGGGIRTREGRYIEPEMNALFKINGVGVVPYIYVRRYGLWFITHVIPSNRWWKES